MTFENINETIQVITHFDGKSIRPLRFLWRGNTYRVNHINGIWHDMNGAEKNFHFHVSTRESGSFELVYSNSNFIWKIGRVCME